MDDAFVKCRTHNSVYHDFFISYRVSADAQTAKEIQKELEAAGATVFLDKECLPYGEPWQSYFLRYLLNAKVIVLLLSDASLKNVEQAHLREDNMLLEIERALDLKDQGKAQVLPVFLPANDKQQLSFFKGFSLERFPLDRHCSKLSSRGDRESVQDTIRAVFAYNAMVVKFDVGDGSLLKSKVHSDILPLLARGKLFAPVPALAPAGAPVPALAPTGAPVPSHALLPPVADPIVWKAVKPGVPIKKPFLAGRQKNGKKLYVITSSINGTVQPGQLSSDGKAEIPYGNFGVKPYQFDILMPPSRGRFSWCPPLQNKLPANAIVAGSDHGDEHPLYIARVFYEGECYIGKVGTHFREGGGTAAFVVDGKEIGLYDFDTLVYEED